MPKAGDEYISVSIMFPHESQMVHSTVKACKQDLNGNPLRYCSDNPTQDTYLYEVEFPDGNVTC